MAKEPKAAQPSKGEVTIHADKPLAVSNPMEAFGQLAGDGFENVTQSDLIIPRLTILQGLSPQIQPKKSEYIKGAKVGDLCDVGTGEIFEPPMLFLPVHYVKQYLEWAPRESGKGLVNIHNDKEILDQCTQNDRGQYVLSNGNYIAETAQFFGLNLSADGRRSFMPMTSTQLKKARQWLTTAQAEKLTRADGTRYTPPLYYRVYQISTVDESNAKGDWIGFKVERGPSIVEYFGPDEWKEWLNECMNFRASILRGEVRGDVGEADDHNSKEGAM